eukprot:2769332-Pyramimonas_sp.AAC.1
MREVGGLAVKVSLTIDAVSVYTSLSSKDLQETDGTDMTADGRTQGKIVRELLLEVMSGTQSFKYYVKQFVPFRGPEDNAEPKSNQF